jgi:predicted dehydrogenase
MISRRTFFQGAALAASATRVIGANNKVSIGVVGLGGRGKDHLRLFYQTLDSRVGGICDVYQPARERARAQLQELEPGAKPAECNDMRDLFANKEIDAISIAIPDHWHALATIWACQAGKDVYVEKPATYNIYEAQPMIDAARKYNRIVQVGLQSRSTPHKLHAMQLLREGTIGKVYMGRGLCFKRRPSIGHTPSEPVPAGLDWDMFLGPAPNRAFTRNRFLYNWHWFWDTGEGDITNQGSHEMDIMCWGLGDRGMPKSAYSTGGKFAYEDDQEVPNTQLSTFEYGDAMGVFEVRGMISGPEAGLPVIPKAVQRTAAGVLFLGSEGWMWVDNFKLLVYQGDDNQKTLEENAPPDVYFGHVLHMANWLKAVHSRNPKELNCPIELGVKSANTAHMACISYRVGRKLAWNGVQGRFVNEPEADKLITRDYRKPYIV